MPEFYTASKACQVLGIKSYKLKRLVERGALPKDIPPGHTKRGRYPKNAVDKLAQKLAEDVEISA